MKTHQMKSGVAIFISSEDDQDSHGGGEGQYILEKANIQVPTKARQSM